MSGTFYRQQIAEQKDDIDFNKEQADYLCISKTVSEVQEKYKGYIELYLEDESNGKSKDSPLLSFIDANGDQGKVIDFIKFKSKNEKDSLSINDLKQLQDLKDNLEVQDYKENIYMFPHNINFGILGGKYIEKDGTEHEIINQDIKKLRRHVYKLLLQKEGSNVIDKYELHFDSSDYVSIYNQFGTRIGRQLIKKESPRLIEGNRYRQKQKQTEGALTINTHKESVELDLMFVA